MSIWLHARCSVACGWEFLSAGLAYCIPVIPLMSFSGLPSYAETSVIPSIENGTPTYTAEPQPHEQRIGQNGLLTRLSGEFVKQTKNGADTLRLRSQKRDA